MDRRRRLAGIVLLLLTVTGAARAREAVSEEVASADLDRLLDLESELESEEANRPAVDCSDGRPDRDCLSGRLGADQTTQTCNGLATVFGAGNCQVHCREDYYACGKCGFAGFAMCTCRENFTCNPYAP